MTTIEWIFFVPFALFALGFATSLWGYFTGDRDESIGGLLTGLYIMGPGLLVTLVLWLLALVF